MLNPNKNRLNYGSILSPPIGYDLDFAIGTTYSLDLDALISSSLSLVLSKETDSKLINNPIYLLESLKGASNKLALFCENGRFQLHNDPKPKHMLLEDMIFQVDNPNKCKGNYCSFHPKFWLLRFEDDEENVLYRFIVLSRNLTFDRSWDISFTMDGMKADEPTDKNKSLSNFILWLRKFVNKEIKKKRTKFEKMERISEELDYIQFDLSEDFEDFDFIINGMDDKSDIEGFPLFQDDLDELFIMTPFLSKSVIKGFNSRKNNNSKAILISREASLKHLKPADCDNFEVYSLKNDVLFGESKSSYDNNQETHYSNQDIHAKLYLMENEETTELYLGSLNASYNALNGNVEFMIRLKTSNDKFNMDNLVEDVFNGEKNGQFSPFDVEIINEDDPEDEGINFDYFVKKITRLNINAQVISNEKDYAMELTVNDYDESEIDKLHIQIKPLFDGNYKDLSKNIIFENLSKLSLSEFFKLKISEGNDNYETIIKIPVSGIPEDRQKEIISSIIENEEIFIKYASVLLEAKNEKGNPIPKGGTGFGYNNGNALPSGLYEKMLKASVKSPENFSGLEYLINNSNDEVIPKGFEEVYNTFMKVVDLNG